MRISPPAHRLASPPPPARGTTWRVVATDTETVAGGLLPNFCSLPLGLGVILYAELLAILLALASPNSLASIWGRLGPLSLLVLSIALTSAVLLCLLDQPMRRLPPLAAALLAWGLIVGIAVGTALITTELLPWGQDGGLFPADGTRGLMLRAGLIAAIVAALLLRYLYLHQQWRRQVEAVANARFQTLQARIRPHFLFNSMNTIASLTRSNPQLAEEVVEDLADLFRASLSTQLTTTLAEEISLARQYLNIEAQRLGPERMAVTWDVGDLPGEAPLPPLILQPLVENAVYHGIQPSAVAGRIHIVGRYRRGFVNLSIRNSLPATPATTVAGKGNQMALVNCAQRMEAMFPGQAVVTKSLIEGDFLVRLAFPYTRSQA